MSSSHPAAPAVRNRLLAALDPDALARLLPRFEVVETTMRQVIQKAGEPVSAVYFPEIGWSSMLTMLADGNSAEVGLCGNEGMVGLPLLLGADTGFVEAMVQGPGTMLRLGAGAFRQALEETPGLERVLLRYSLAFHEQVGQTAACNGHHALDQRLARWLLMAHDRAAGDEFPMTQEFLALMLCVHRPGVTLAARMFQQAGIVQYGKGSIRIVDREGLEAAACECYGAVRQRFEFLLGAAKG